MNALAYALFLGRSLVFQSLHKVGCSLSLMEILLQNQGVTAIVLICCKGYSDILSYYLPLFTENHNSDKPQDKTYTIDFGFTMEIKPPTVIKNTNTAIQMAVQYNHISIITTAYEYYKDAANTPFELDLEYQDETSGENCALIACRYGSYPMVKFLHQKCGANFMIRNKVGENAIQIATAGSRLHPHLQYLQIIVYLVDIVGVDVKYNHEETLLLAEDKEIISYLEKKLRLNGVEAKKIEIEKSVEEAVVPQSKDDEVIDQIQGRRFNFMTMYTASCGDKDDSVLSSISDQHSLGSIFGSTLSEFHK